jgi:hypothetical protein
MADAPQTDPRRVRRGLVASAVAGLVLAAAPSLPLLNSLMRWVPSTSRVPGSCVTQQKFVIPWLVLAAVAFGCGSTG